jgi:hypothetical protein
VLGTSTRTCTGTSVRVRVRVGVILTQASNLNFKENLRTESLRLFSFKSKGGRSMLQLEGVLHNSESASISAVCGSHCSLRVGKPGAAPKVLTREGGSIVVKIRFIKFGARGSESQQLEVSI